MGSDDAATARKVPEYGGAAQTRCHDPAGGGRAQRLSSAIRSGKPTARRARFRREANDGRFVSTEYPDAIVRPSRFVAGRCRSGAADRVRESDESAPGEGVGAAQGNGGAPGARRDPAAHRATTLDRKYVARGLERLRQLVACPWDEPFAVVVQACARTAYRARSETGSARAGLEPGALAPDGRAIWTCARVAGGAAERRRRAERRCAQSGFPRLAPAQCVCHRAGGDVVAAAAVRRALFAGALAGAKTLSGV